MTFYSKYFYFGQQAGSKHSAEQVVPLLMELISPETVVDVGCGVGTWLSVFRDQGVKKVMGIDGHYVNPDMLHIPKNCFIPHDLTQQLSLEEQFDLVISLEVAEHLPEHSASQFVENLTRLGSVVVFSAAIPFQGGVNHINEQWPEYWIDIFKKYGYSVIDCLRDPLWNNNKITPCYIQNMFLFIAEQRLDDYPKLLQKQFSCPEKVYRKIHPRMWIWANHPKQQSLKKLLAALPFSMKNAVMNRIKYLFK